jgi:uncharacterized protein (DUF1684 family)
MQKLILLALILLLTSCFTNDRSTYEKEIHQYRKEYLQSFLEEDRSPLEKSDLKNLTFFQADSNFAITADYQLLTDQEAMDFPTSSGKKKSYRKYARLEFVIQGKTLTLFVYQSITLKEKDEYRDYLFLPFTDLTSGEQSYGGGRYIDLIIQDFKDGKVLVDFNKAYNPWCAYSDGFNCPIPPRENDLEVAITAGEMNYRGEYKHKDQNEDH